MNVAFLPGRKSHWPYPRCWHGARSFGQKSFNRRCAARQRKIWCNVTCGVLAKHWVKSISSQWSLNVLPTISQALPKSIFSQLIIKYFPLNSLHIKLFPTYTQFSTKSILVEHWQNFDVCQYAWLAMCLMQFKFPLSSNWSNPRTSFFLRAIWWTDQKYS